MIRWLLLLCLFLNVSCFRNTDKLITAIEGRPNSLDPVNAFSDGALLVLSQVYEPLINYHYLVRPFRMESTLSEDIPQISGNGKIYRFKVKKDVLYHPVKGIPEGRSVLAKDFITQFKRLADPENDSPIRSMLVEKILGLKKVLNDLGQPDSVEKALLDKDVPGLRLIDTHTFEVELNQPDNFFIYWFSTYFIVPMPEEVIKQEINLKENFIGTSPYRLSVEGKKYKLKKFKNYRDSYYPTLGDRKANVRGLLKNANKEIPLTSEFEIIVESNFEKRLQMFLDEEVDWMDVSNTEYGRVSKDERIVELLDAEVIVLTNFPSLAMRWLGFNMNDDVIGGESGKNIRKAIAYAIDREKYNEVLSNGTNMEANSIINPGIWGYNPSTKFPFKFNIEKAKSLLRGYKKPIRIKYSTRTDSLIGTTEANFLKKELKKVGIELEVEVLTFKQFLKKGRAGQLQFWTDYWIYDYPDAQNILQLLYSKNFPGINKSAYQNSRVDEYYEKLLSDPSNNKKQEYIEKIESELYQDLPWVIMSYDRSYYISRKHVQNLKKSSFIRNYFKYLKFSSN